MRELIMQDGRPVLEGENRTSDEGHSCGNCRFFRKEGAATCRKGPPLGACFLVPEIDALGNPRMKTPTTGYWPTVQPTQWCGSWEPKPDEPKKETPCP